VNRRRLLTGAEPVEQAMETGSSVAGQGDPAGEIGAAWSVKERLRILLKERELSKIRWWPVDSTTPWMPRARDHSAGQDHQDLMAGNLG
jgi:hypothetical protein